MRPSPERTPRRYVGHITCPLYLTLGFLCVALGFIGALLPLMPTAIFLILAAGSFARSSPRFEAWLLGHWWFGPTLRSWREDGAIGPQAKFMACAGMALGYALFWWSLRPSLMVDRSSGWSWPDARPLS